MSGSTQNNMETHIGDDSDHDQGSGAPASCNTLMPAIPPDLANNIGNPNYCPTLVSKLIK